MTAGETIAEYRDYSPDEVKQHFDEWAAEQERLAKIQKAKDQARLEAYKRRCKQRLDEWESICPGIYQDSDLSKLPNVKKYQEALKWADCQLTYEKPGLLLYGKTGRGKTRAMWATLRAQANEGESVYGCTASAWGKEIVARTKPGGLGGFDEWMEDIMGTGFLALDELDKLTFSRRVESEFFDLIETRFSNGQPLILSMNATAEQFASLFSVSYQEAVMRRLKEFCHVINFNVQ